MALHRHLEDPPGKKSFKLFLGWHEASALKFLFLGCLFSFAEEHAKYLHLPRKLLLVKSHQQISVRRVKQVGRRELRLNFSYKRSFKSRSME